MVPDRSPATWAVTLVFAVLATVFVAGRIYTRACLVQRINQDDWWMLAAWVVSTAFSVSIIVATHYGLGKHQADIPEEAYGPLRKAEYAISVLYNPALMLTKTSIIVFYLSVMSKDVDVAFKWLNWFTLGLVNLAGLGLTLYNLLQCMPVAAGYTYPTPTGAQCTDILKLYLSSAPVNIITEVAILLLPIPILTGLRLPKKQKIILVVTFGFGIFVAAVDVVRLAYLQTASSQPKSVSTSDLQKNDFSYNASFSFMWCAVEVNVGCICACVPSLKHLFLRFLPTLVKDASVTDTGMDHESPVNGDGRNTNINTTTTTGNSSTNSGEKSLGPLMGNASLLRNPAAFYRPRLAEHSGFIEGDKIDFVDILTGPHKDDGAASPSRPAMSLMRTATTVSAGTSATAKHSAPSHSLGTKRRQALKSTRSNFDFVYMSGPRNMLLLSTGQSLWPVAVVTVMFFLWGCAYGLLSSLNNAFQDVSKISSGHSLGLHTAYYAGYAVGPMTVGRFVLKNYGFRACMMAGLWIYGCGTLVFWPSAVLINYPAFVFSNFFVGFGLSCLEIAANPYIALCGPLEYAEARLNLSQSIQAIGTVFSSLLASKALFRNVSETDSLVNAEWAYLGIALFVWALAIIFYYVPLPEASNDQLQEQADSHQDAHEAKLGPCRVVMVTLALGVFSQWCYVGTQECYGWYDEETIQTYFPSSPIQPSDFLLVTHAVFAVGRFLAGMLSLFFPPRMILLVLYTGLAVCTAVQVKVTGPGVAVIQIMAFFLEAGIFALIFAICLRGLGVHTKTGSAFMTTAISGGAPMPRMQWAVAGKYGLHKSYLVPLVALVLGAVFPLYLNLVPLARLQVDPKYNISIREKQPYLRPASSATAATDPSLVHEGIQRPGSEVAASGAVAAEDHIDRQSSHEQDEAATGAIRALKQYKGGTRDGNMLHMTDPKGLVGDLTPWPEDAAAAAAAAAAEVRRGENGLKTMNGIQPVRRHQLHVSRHEDYGDDYLHHDQGHGHNYNGNGNDDDDDDELTYHRLMRSL